jgi:hypothetical protein
MKYTTNTNEEITKVERTITMKELVYGLDIETMIQNTLDALEARDLAFMWARRYITALRAGDTVGAAIADKASDHFLAISNSLLD